jgi:hypothetical protein
VSSARDTNIREAVLAEVLAFVAFLCNGAVEWVGIADANYVFV